MSTFKRVAISNRHLCPRSLQEQAALLAGRVDILILREKDLTEDAYERLAAQVRQACQDSGIELICHTFLQAARKIGCTAVHLPLPDFQEQWENLGGFKTIGVSIHSLEEALQVQEIFQVQKLRGYLTASNIFETACKEGLPGKGTEFLSEICRKVSLPVYGLGGITADNEELIRTAGAAGACRMSDYMK